VLQQTAKESAPSAEGPGTGGAAAGRFSMEQFIGTPLPVVPGIVNQFIQPITCSPNSDFLERKSQNPIRIHNATAAKSPGSSGIIPVGPAAVPVHHSSQDLVIQ